MTFKFYEFTLLALPFLSSGVLPQGTSSATTGQDEPRVTAMGCLKREADVPGRQERGAERLGIGRDFVLTDVRIVAASGTSSKGSGSVPPASVDALKMAPKSEARYQVTGLDAKTLEPHVNHLVVLQGRLDDDRVGVTRGAQDTASAGKPSAERFEPTGRTSASDAKALGKDKNSASGKSGSSQESAAGELPKLDATSIRGIAQTCSQTR
jgi:hypothetical protein